MSCVTRNLKPLFCCDSCHLATDALALSSESLIQVSISRSVSFARPKTPPPRPYSVRGSPKTRRLAATDAPTPCARRALAAVAKPTPAAADRRSLTWAARMSAPASTIAELAGSTIPSRARCSACTSSARRLSARWSPAVDAEATSICHSDLGRRSFVSSNSGAVRTSGPPVMLHTSSVKRYFKEASFRLWPSHGIWIRSSASKASTSLSTKRATG
mmetsp:Transcript_108526/g.317524  ORF Transcript_108526/g.317524 Transcript_108526/m.317524 type:complete len:216 (-) Transcript_108526:565-1212(-)